MPYFQGSTPKPQTRKVSFSVHHPKDVQFIRARRVLIDDDIGAHRPNPSVLADSRSRSATAWEISETVDRRPELAVPLVSYCRTGDSRKVGNDLEKIASGLWRNDDARHRAPIDFR